ncbi:MAG: sugar transporter permease [Paenibacillaceae bacterium]|jgi:putative aldouronate transport system permease protein|nr:sugar transporter permease [Paenibacillaceae bacterium]
MKKKLSMGSLIFDTSNVIFLSLLTLIMFYPLLYVIMASLSDSALMQIHSGFLWKPEGFSTDAYKEVIRNPAILSGYRNTLFLVIVGTGLNVTCTSLGAFVLSRKHFYIRKQLTLVIVFTMFFSGGLVPTYLLVKGLGLGNTLWACIMPTLISTWNFMIMRTYFQAIPDSLEESAKLDGANDIVILFRIFLPLCGPIMAVMVLYYGVAHWNQWFSAMIYLQNRSYFPLQLILREILLANNTDSMLADVGGADKAAVGETIKYATIVVATLPILCVYPFLQKYFVKGVLIGAVKG